MIKKLKEYFDNEEGGVSIDGINTDEVFDKINEIIDHLNKPELEAPKSLLGTSKMVIKKGKPVIK